MHPANLSGGQTLNTEPLLFTKRNPPEMTWLPFQEGHCSFNREEADLLSEALGRGVNANQGTTDSVPTHDYFGRLSATEERALIETRAAASRKEHIRYEVFVLAVLLTVFLRDLRGSSFVGARLELKKREP
jgi:hypothetical protein